jgi:hypothetical protein
MRLRTLRKVEESRSRSSRIIHIIRYKQLLKQHYNIVILRYYDYGATVHHPLALHNRYPETHRFPPFSRRETGRISAHKHATDKSGVPKEAQDNGLSAGMSYGRQTPPRRPSGQKGDISHAQWDISRQKNGDN